MYIVLIDTMDVVITVLLVLVWIFSIYAIYRYIKFDELNKKKINEIEIARAELAIFEKKYKVHLNKENWN